MSCQMVCKKSIDFKLLIRIPAHRIVLFSAYPHLRTLLSAESEDHDDAKKVETKKGRKAKEMKEHKAQNDNAIVINDIDGNTLKLLIDYCYTGRIEITADNVNSIILAATKMKLPEIQAMCEMQLTQTLGPNNCFRLWLLANECAFAQLAEHTISYIRDRFQFLVRCEEYTELQLPAVECLLADNELNVYSEESVFYALTRWIHYDEEARMPYFSQLVLLIRSEHLKLSVRHFSPFLHLAAASNLIGIFVCFFLLLSF